mmetsp:Transcript_17243/g.31154  ORF Transcript_17243/g.31154 Transcript_17243/m.31154 type:complete len:205 (+) Transcript_17243:327-941(+)
MSNIVLSTLSPSFLCRRRLIPTLPSSISCCRVQEVGPIFPPKRWLNSFCRVRSHVCMIAARVARWHAASDRTYFRASPPRCEILDVKNRFTSSSYLANLLEYLNTYRISQSETDTTAIKSKLALSNRKDPATAPRLKTLTRSKTRASAGRNTNFVFGRTAAKFAMGTSTKARICSGISSGSVSSCSTSVLLGSLSSTSNISAIS